MRSVPIEFPNHGRFSRDWLDEHVEAAQALLSQCKGQYPLCLCREPGLPLYIAQRARFYLARLPHTGPQHAPDCPSFEPERALCGWGIYSPSAIEDQGDGRIAVKLAVPLSIRSGRAGHTAPVSSFASVERAFRDTMALRGLLHLLWERGQFHRWTPRMKNRRRYRQLHKYLLEAADTITARNEPLTRHFYMPEPFDSTQALELGARRQAALRERSQSSAGTPLRVLVCGQVRAIIDDTHGCGLCLAHWPKELIIRCERDALSRLRNENEFAWVDWPSLHSQLRLMVLLTMQRSRQGHWVTAELESMVTTEEYIPVLNMEEALVAHRLVTDDRQFLKPLPYDARSTRLPNFLLTDCTEVVPLEIIGRSDADAAARHMRIGQYREEGRPYWLWDVQESALPPAIMRPAA